METRDIDPSATSVSFFEPDPYRRVQDLGCIADQSAVAGKAPDCLVVVDETRGNPDSRRYAELLPDCDERALQPEPRILDYWKSGDRQDD